VDACDRLSQLNLADIQQREIVRVLLHCCGNVRSHSIKWRHFSLDFQERSYNPYYTLVCQHLCRTSHSHKITLQYSFWDLLRELGETNVGGAELTKNINDATAGFVVQDMTTRLKNIAKAYAWWIAKDSSSLTIFKVCPCQMLRITVTVQCLGFSP
jgi:nucleolar MIF4G domain-containing protein 1